MIYIIDNSISITYNIKQYDKYNICDMIYMMQYNAIHYNVMQSNAI